MVLIGEQIGRQLRQLRHERGMRLVDVQAKSHVSHSHLSKIERGLSEPSSEILDALCDVFDVVPEVILHPRTREREAAMSDPEAEYRRLAGLQLGHSRADIKLRIRRAQLSHLAYACPFCGVDPWTECVVQGTNRRVSRTHSARNWVAIHDIYGADYR